MLLQISNFALHMIELKKCITDLFVYLYYTYPNGTEVIITSQTVEKVARKLLFLPFFV